MEYRHPFLVNSRLAVWYGIFWIVLAGAVELVAVGVNKAPLWAALPEILYLWTFALIGTSVWYVIRYSTIENNSVARIVVAHLLAATIIVFIWLYVTAVLLKLIYPESKEWFHRPVANRMLAGYVMYVAFVVFFYAVNYYYAFKEKLQNETKLKTLVKEAELHALKTQINPHFLFNSLNSISSLTMTDPVKAQEMVINLSQLMRYSLKHDQRESVSLRQEIENNRLYLKIEKVRFGEKLKPVFAVDDDCFDLKIPNMILQPLYENAIKYGVYEATEPVEIFTRAECRDGVLVVTIRNNYDPSVISRKGEGIGLQNIRDRLQLLFGNPHLMLVENSNNQFSVTLTIPQNVAL